jgi:hypothetical protein
MVVPSPAPALVPCALGRRARDEMLAEAHSRGLGVAGPLVVVTLGALRRVLGASSSTALPAVREALAGVDVGLRADDDARSGRSGVARDCADIAAWLEARGAVRMACGYAEAAAALSAECPRYALSVARLNGSLARTREAAEWGVRAWRLAGRAGDADTRVAALVALGQAATLAQRYGDAARAFTLAGRYAAVHGAPAREGDALHGLALVRHAQDRHAEASELVALALAAYGPRRECVHDLARSWLSMLVDGGEYRGAVMLGKLLLSLSLPPADELGVCALLARGAAALGWELSYESFCLRAILAMGSLSPGCPHVAPMLDLARAHGSLAFWPRVLLAADRALADALAHADDDAAEVARRMLQAADLRCIPPDVQQDLFPDQEPEEMPEGQELPSCEPVAALVESFRAALAGA